MVRQGDIQTHTNNRRGRADYTPRGLRPGRSGNDQGWHVRGQGVGEVACHSRGQLGHLAHGIRAPRARLMERTHDDICHCPGYWVRHYRCRIEIYEHPNLTPVLVCTPLLHPDGRCPSLDHAVLAAEVIRIYCPRAFDALDEPLVWIERNPCPAPSPHWPGNTAYTRVTFDWYTPSLADVGEERPLLSIGTPTLWGMSHGAVAELLTGGARRTCAWGCGRPATVELEPGRGTDPPAWICAACAIADDQEEDEG